MRYLLLFWFFLASFPAVSQVSDQQYNTVAILARPLTIDKINITGNKKTRREIILREIGYDEGRSLPADSLPLLLEESRQRLVALGLFTEVIIVADSTAAFHATVNIHVKERWYIIPEPTFQLADRNFNVWWTEQNRDIRRTIIGITLRNKNFQGNLENIALTAQVGYTKKLFIDYVKPYVDRAQKLGIGFSAGFSESQETFYTTDSNKLQFIKAKDRYILRQYEIGGSLLYRPAYASRHMFRVAYKQYRIEDTIASLNKDYFEHGSRELKMVELTYRLEVNRTDNWNYPLKGTKLIGQLISRIGITGLDKQVMATLEVGRYMNPWKKWYISTTFRGRLSLPEEQPYVFQGALGTKYDYVRGYEYYVIDGSHFALLRFNFKRELVNTSIRNIPVKYLSAIPVRIYPKVFADAGYVRNRFEGNSFLNNRMLYSAGLGVDIFTAYDIKIRLEYAWNHLGEKGLFLHFNSE
jgi:outer membrane protein assembly factor BamA